MKSTLFWGIYGTFFVFVQFCKKLKEMLKEVKMSQKGDEL